jgi:hypothetical protein
VIFACAIATLVLPAAAVADPVETRLPFSDILFNPCTGELLVAEGVIHVVTRSEVAPDGSTHNSVHANLQGVKGIALATGARYVVQQNLEGGGNADFDFAPSTTHLTIREHYVRQGEDGALIEDDDFFSMFHFQLTINADGVPTVVRLEEDVKCQ